VPLELSFAAGTLIALLIPTVFGWTPAGLMSPWPSLVQLADVVGERGVSVILAFSTALLARAALIALGRQAPGVWARLARQRAVQALCPALAAALLLVGLTVHGRLRMASIRRATESLPTVRLGLVNQAVGPTDRWDPRNHASIMRTLRDLTRQTEALGAEMTVWPEAAYPYAVEERGLLAPRGAQAIVGAGIRGPVLTGLIKRVPPMLVAPGVVERNSYNSATIVMPDGSMQPTYDKLQLLWFGEMVPGGAYLPWLRRLFQKSGGLIPGKEPRALKLPRSNGPSLQIGVLNCYEDTLPGVGRVIATALVPNLVVNVTNDAWFVGTAEPELHARLAVMRAIELRRDLVRAVNLGVTSWVDASGTVRAREDSNGPGILMVSPAIRESPLSWYARFGDAPAVLLLSAAALAFAWRRRRSPDAAAAQPEAPAIGGKPAGESLVAVEPSSTKDGPTGPDQAT
jgi:apolipoprotein N-acyltransferase